MLWPQATTIAPCRGLELSDNLAVVAGDMGQLQVLYLKCIPTGGDRI